MFTGDGSNTLAILTFFANGVGAVFISLENIQFLDAPFSVFDVFIAVILWQLLAWYIIRIITAKDTYEDTLTEHENYKQYGETLKSSATEDEIDFSEEIVHE